MEKSLSAASEAVRGKWRGLPRIPWVARWFTAGQAVLKLLQLLSCSIAVIVLFTWSKDPSSVFSFDNLVLEDARGQLDFRPHWYFFASVGLFTSGYSLLLPAAGFVGLDVWPSARTCLSVLCTLLWLVGGPVMSVAITIMEASRYANQNLVDFLMPKVATGFGFLSLGLFVVDVLLALMAVREHQTSDRFIKEVASMSVSHRTAAKPQAPSASSQPPSPGSNPPSAGSHAPSAGSHAPSASSHPPSAGSHPPSAGSHPPSVGSQTPSCGHTPSAGGHTPSSHSLPAGDRTPGGSQTPSTDSLPLSPQIEQYVSAPAIVLGAEEGWASQLQQDTAPVAPPSDQPHP